GHAPAGRAFPAGMRRWPRWTASLHASRTARRLPGFGVKRALVVAAQPENLAAGPDALAPLPAGELAAAQAAPGDERLFENAQSGEELRRPHERRALVPAIVAQPAAVQFDEHRAGLLAGAPAAVVDDLGGRQAGDLPAGGAHPPAPVDLLAVHEVPLVERAGRLHRGAARDQAGAEREVDREGAVARGARVAPVQARAGESPAEREEVEEDLRQRGEAEADRLLAPVGVEEPRPDDADRGVLVQVAHQRRQRARARLGVGVEQAEGPAARQRQAAVVTRSEAGVALQLDQSH